ncbi:hypothetical protein LFX25_16405 [Leptospira sp. FAT2]|uniref:hypothetical protein n=1 Tax=Leptospira sanjuanensis TaxID=2879643 RepID=UPI001EE88419|nr:hypothetical protein [Leptospira sanjuanensis]MCG6194823.1 hypothetical protein [Leptospira sanjuanensis]
MNPKELKFFHHSLQAIRECAREKSQSFDEYAEPRYASLYRKHKFLIPSDQSDKIRSLLRDSKFRAVFGLK